MGDLKDDLKSERRIIREAYFILVTLAPFSVKHRRPCIAGTSEGDSVDLESFLTASVARSAGVESEIWVVIDRDNFETSIGSFALWFPLPKDKAVSAFAVPFPREGHAGRSPSAAAVSCLFTAILTDSSEAGADLAKRSDSRC
jgi:hypothetical protein